MTHAESFRKVCKVLVETQKVDPNTLTERTRLDDDLDMDNRAIIEMCAWLTEEFDVVIEPRDIRDKRVGNVAGIARIKSWMEQQKPKPAMAVACA